MHEVADVPTWVPLAYLIAGICFILALIMASVNIFGGFLVTQRMLGMYQKKKK